ncbi:hypothetical protein GPECTOR_23g8 [Gonium pectorale]|uniref:Uncharacterized protein n=1 Tax=Gonium pectorale TaxID=33097 RepID=A0A150GH27_GONPE|nr:hypothetical protein GPECTOR_23g8 [Gonium pectorale]|eukprot:KXZ49152.1 hypothetical protein GPECTOR_23g8 [Gonium pectorale]
MYYRRIPLRSGGADVMAWPFGPDEVLRQLASPSRVAQGADPLDHLPTPGMVISIDSASGGAGRAENHVALPSAAAAAAAAAAAGGAGHAPGGVGGECPIGGAECPFAHPHGGAEGRAAGPQGRHNATQRRLPAGRPGSRGPALSDLQSYSINAFVQPIMTVLSAHTRSVERDLQRNAEVRRAARQAADTVRQQLEDKRQQLRGLDAQREAAAARGDYGSAQALRAAMDALGGEVAALEAEEREAADALDALVEMEGSVRHAQASQLLTLGSELRELQQAASLALARLHAELRGLQERVQMTVEARTELGQELSRRTQSADVRRELRGLAEAAQAERERAAADLEQSRLANRAALGDAAALAANLTRADSLVQATALELDLLRGQLALALDFQVGDGEALDLASQLTSALEELAGLVPPRRLDPESAEEVVEQLLS